MKSGIDQRGSVHRRADQALRQLLRGQVDDPFVEAVAIGGRAVVRHLRGQQRDQLAERATLVTIQVVADRTRIDQQQRPGVVRVHRVGV